MNFNYGAAKQRKSVKPVVVHKRVWGERVGNTCFVLHNGAMYMESKMNAKPKKVRYFAYDPELKASAELTAEAVKVLNTFIHQRAQAKIPMIDVKIQNIREIKINGVHYIVE